MAEGDFFLDKPVSPEVVELYKTLSKTIEHKNECDWASLTPRQKQVLELLARGHSYKVIGDTLCVSPRTVDKHRATIMNKLGLAARADLTIFALIQGIIKLDALNT